MCDHFKGRSRNFHHQFFTDLQEHSRSQEYTCCTLAVQHVHVYFGLYSRVSTHRMSPCSMMHWNKSVCQHACIIVNGQWSGWDCPWSHPMYWSDRSTCARVTWQQTVNSCSWDRPAGHQNRFFETKISPFLWLKTGGGNDPTKSMTLQDGERSWFVWSCHRIFFFSVLKRVWITCGQFLIVSPSVSPHLAFLAFFQNIELESSCGFPSV